VHPLGIILLGTITLVGMLWLRSKPPKQRRAATIKLIVLLVTLGLLYLAITGRLHWLGALVAALLPFARRLIPLLRFLPLIGSIFKSRRGSANPKHRSDGNQSEIETRLLHMTLDHDSGVMYGTVLQGPLRGRELGDLEEQEFLDLLDYCRQHDEESGRVLEAYLDKRFGESWRVDDHGQQQSHSNGNNDGGPLTRDEAYEVLGLSPGASEEEIIQAHRKLMQKVHPDRGGSTYLAARINEAKDCLLK